MSNIMTGPTPPYSNTGGIPCTEPDDTMDHIFRGLCCVAVLLCAWPNTYKASSCKPQTERFSMFFVLSLWYRFGLTNDKDIGYAALLCKQ